MISKDTAAARRPRRRPAPPTATAAPYFLCGPRIHEFLQEMHREVFAGRDRPAAHRRRDARRHRRARPGCSPTRPAPRSTWCSSSSTSGSTTAATKWDVPPAATCATSRRRFGRWQAGLADVGWNSLYWNNHDQPRVVSRFGDDGEHRVAVGQDARHGAAPAPRHAVRLPGRGARHDERARSPAIDDFRDIESLNHYADGGRPRAPTRSAVLAALRRDEPRQRPHADAVGRVAARRLHHRHAVDRGQPELRRDQRRGRAWPTRTRSSTTTAG